MPELPEVETVRRGLDAAMAGARFTAVDLRRPDLRFPFPERFSERLIGQRVEALRRRAKYLMADLDGARRARHAPWHVRVFPHRKAREPIQGGCAKSSPHDHVTFELSTGARIIYNDPRRFGFMQLIPRHGICRASAVPNIGIEPLGGEFDGAALARLFAGKTTSLKAALLDQTLIAGLGNIYVCEALHRAGLSPRRAAGSLVRNDGAPSPRAVVWLNVIREVLNEAVAAGGSSLRDHRQTDGALGYFQHNFRVYGRDMGTLRALRRPGYGRITQAGRATFYCGGCQR